jgi:hypothetical protein
VSRLIDRLPIPSLENSFTLPGGLAVPGKALQPIVWISVAPPHVVDLPGTAPRFPAVIDTGFNQTLLIQDWHLQMWGGVNPADLQVFPGEPAHYGSQAWHFRIGDIWLHPNQPGEAAIAENSRPFCLEVHPGILIVSEQERRQRLPLLGMRALAWNRLKLRLEFDSPQLGFLSLDTP